MATLGTILMTSTQHQKNTCSTNIVLEQALQDSYPELEAVRNHLRHKGHLPTRAHHLNSGSGISCAGVLPGLLNGGEEWWIAHAERECLPLLHCREKDACTPHAQSSLSQNISSP
jgi:hypothetical protein